MLMFGLWWLGRAEASARRSSEGFGDAADVATKDVADDQFIRERATTAHEFDPAEISHGKHSDTAPSIVMAVLPLLVVVAFNLLLSIFVLPRLDFSYLAEERWGSTSLAAVAGVWSVAVALAAASVTLIVINWQRLPDVRASMKRTIAANAVRATIVQVAIATSSPASTTSQAKTRVMSGVLSAAPLAQ